jgi:endo-1,4-beta-mannosidase
VVRETDGLPDGGALYILPSVKQLTAPTWRRLRQLAQDGAVVYASQFGGDHDTNRSPWWPGLDGLFGVRKHSRYGLTEPISGDSVEVRFVTGFGNIAAQTRLSFVAAGNQHVRSFLPVTADGADVIAVDELDRPVLLTYRVGLGAMVLCTYPFEYMASQCPHDNPEPTWRLYSALAEFSGAAADVTIPDPRVYCDELLHADGRRFVWLVNLSPETVQVQPVVSAGRLAPLGKPNREHVTEAGLDPYGVRVLERVMD